jgi:ribonuclease BN (tRNA processing enzyme)
MSFVIDCYNIEEYSHLLPSNKFIKALFITHQHYDHFLGMQFLKDNKYSIEYLVFSPYVRRRGDSSVSYEEWKDFFNFVDYFERNGTKLYKPFRQNSFKKPWWTNSGLKFWMIGPNKSISESDTRELHDACLVLHVNLGGRKICFTGDASYTSLNWIANNTKNYCNDILHRAFNTPKCSKCPNYTIT